MLKKIKANGTDEINFLKELNARNVETDKKVTDYLELTKYIEKGYRIITLSREGSNSKIEVLAFIIIKDNIRDKYFESNNIKVLRYSNYEINTMFEEVCQDILNNITENTSSVT